MTLVLVLILLERFSRRRARFHHTGNRNISAPRCVLTGVRGWVAFTACLLPVLFGFLLPALQLTSWAMATAAQTVDSGFVTLMTHSLLLAGAAALATLMLAVFMAYGNRLRPSALNNISVRVSGMGYAVPGTVIAVGVMLPFAGIDNVVDAWSREHLGVSSGLLLSGTLFALLFAYVVRFLAVALNTVESGLARIRPSVDDAARSLGLTPARVLRAVHLPMLRGTLLTAVLLVFVDVLKELPATLILRPFNFNTLAVRAYELASDERLADASSAALAIVIVGIVPVIILSRSIAADHK
jgi:iron(III) transport system permease protein